MRNSQSPQVTKFIEKYRRNWKEDIDTINSGRIPITS
jgi:hypothetical protein